MTSKAEIKRGIAAVLFQPYFIFEGNLKEVFISQEFSVDFNTLAC